MKNEQNIRPVGGVEKLFLVLNRIAPKTFAMSAELNVCVTENQITEFAIAIQQRYKHLRANLMIDENLNYWFNYDNRNPIEVSTAEYTDPETWKRKLESELCKPFNLARGPLFRILLLSGSNKTTVVLLAHHSIGDGFSMISIFEDLLIFLKGEILEEFQIPQSMDQVLGLEDKINITAKLKDMESYQKAHLDPGESKVYIDNLKLDQQTTSAIVKESKKRGITVNGLLNAALAMAIAEKGYSRVNRVISLRTPASVRHVLGTGKDFGLNIITRLSDLKIDSASDIWELGRKVNVDLKDIGSEEETRAYVSQFRHLLFQPMKFEWFVNVIGSTAGIDLMLSNLGKIEFTESKDNVAITALWGPVVIAGDGSEQTIGALTLSGELHLTHTSMEPAEGLLVKACEMILKHIS